MMVETAKFFSHSFPFRLLDSGSAGFTSAFLHFLIAGANQIMKGIRSRFDVSIAFDTRGCASRD
jgi:hypothetical protein